MNAVGSHQHRALDPFAVPHQERDAIPPCLVTHGLAAGMDTLAAKGLEENPLERGTMEEEEGGVDPQVTRAQAGQDLTGGGPQLELLFDAAGRGDGGVEADPPQGEHRVGLDGDP